MNSSRTLRRAALACALAAVASAAPAQSTSVPFKATVQVTDKLSFGVMTCPTLVGGTLTGTGTASHLGAVKMQASDCVLPLMATFSYQFFNGSLTLIAANGDQLRAVYQGELVPTAIGSPIYRLQGVYSIVGGTGRFKNAQGSGTLSGSEDLSAGLTATGQLNATGTLSY